MEVECCGSGVLSRKREESRVEREEASRDGDRQKLKTTEENKQRSPNSTDSKHLHFFHPPPTQLSRVMSAQQQQHSVAARTQGSLPANLRNPPELDRHRWADDSASPGRWTDCLARRLQPLYKHSVCTSTVSTVCTSTVSTVSTVLPVVCTS